jgi:hypothetical protein
MTERLSHLPQQSTWPEKLKDKKIA